MVGSKYDLVGLPLFRIIDDPSEYVLNLLTNISVSLILVLIITNPSPPSLSASGVKLNVYTLNYLV